VESKRLRFWFENTLKSRRNSPHTPIITCAQRLAVDDLCGYVLTSYKEKVLHIKVPALQDGVSIMPDTVSTESLLMTKAVNEFTFFSQYQQEPIVPGGNLIKVAKLRVHHGEMLSWDDKIIVSDTAIKKGQSNDYYVAQCWAKANSKCYLLDQIRGHWTTPEFIRLSAQFYYKHMTNQEYSPVSRFLIEEAGSGPGIIQSLNVLGIPAEGIIRIKDKGARVNDILAFVETGMVYVPSDDAADWMPDFRAELAAFTQDDTHAHDDQVDCFADGISNLLGQGLSILDVLGNGRLN
jgi:predicted phage terminase large subunit-like protein